MPISRNREAASGQDDYNIQKVKVDDDVRLCKVIDLADHGDVEVWWWDTGDRECIPATRIRGAS